MILTKVVALHSGGLDSSVMLYHLRSLDYEVLPLSINYGQRHWKELNAAADICVAGNFRWRRLDLEPLRELLQGSSQTDPKVEVPEGHYADDNMRITVVPNRNMVLLSMAEAYAISNKAGFVAYAAHAGDHSQYPDCRPEFVNAFRRAIELCDYQPAALITPFVKRTKAQIVKIGSILDVPFHLTWSCYKGGELHCGRCGTDVERAEAFYLAGVHDPTEYEDPNYWKTVSKEYKG